MSKCLHFPDLPKRRLSRKNFLDQPGSCFDDRRRHRKKFRTRSGNKVHRRRRRPLSRQQRRHEAEPLSGPQRSLCFREGQQLASLESASRKKLPVQGMQVLQDQHRQERHRLPRHVGPVHG